MLERRILGDLLNIHYSSVNQTDSVEAPEVKLCGTICVPRLLALFYIHNSGKKAAIHTSSRHSFGLNSSMPVGSNFTAAILK